MLANTRGIYSLAARGLGPAPDTFSLVDEKTGMPANSSILGLLFAAAWFLYFYGANLVPVPWFGVFSFDSSELPVVTIYALYIPIFFMFMRKARGLGVLRPVGYSCACAFGKCFYGFCGDRRARRGSCVLSYCICRCDACGPYIWLASESG